MYIFSFLFLFLFFNYLLYDLLALCYSLMTVLCFYVYVFYCTSYVCFLVLYVLPSILYALCFCIVLCICVLMYIVVFFPFICVQVYGTLPPGDKSIAVNKYHIIYLPQHHIFKHLHPTLFPKCNKPNLKIIQNNRENYSTTYFNFCIFRKQTGRQNDLDRIIVGIL